MEEQKFAVGQRVRLTKDEYGLAIGTEVEILEVEDCGHVWAKDPREPAIYSAGMCFCLSFIEPIVDAVVPKPKFKVGQVWRTRDGGEATIESIDEGGTYPINSTIDCHTADGSAWSGEESPGDLIELITDVPGEDASASAPVAPVLAEGQVWERRDGRTIRIVQAEPAKYRGELVAQGEDGHWRRRSARISDVTESPYDLVRLLPVTEPSAPAIADAILADARDLAPQHDTEAAQAGDQGAQCSLRPVNDEDRALFDALIMQASAMGNFSNPGTEKVLSTIREIIDARRAL